MCSGEVNNWTLDVARFKDRCLRIECLLSNILNKHKFRWPRLYPHWGSGWGWVAWPCITSIDVTKKSAFLKAHELHTAVGQIEAQARVRLVLFIEAGQRRRQDPQALGGISDRTFLGRVGDPVRLDSPRQWCRDWGVCLSPEGWCSDVEIGEFVFRQKDDAGGYASWHQAYFLPRRPILEKSPCPPSASLHKLLQSGQGVCSNITRNKKHIDYCVPCYIRYHMSYVVKNITWAWKPGVTWLRLI